ncbi:site-specific integrase [Herbaspirillum sp. NPDC087042]|uniref:site-specific integrase n=1 Tax=Herbaspirillum sp. NPDC087042 TaxID=3364004 RepID=UPI0037F6FC49
MATRNKSAIEALTNWVELYTASPNTCRAYQRELDRLQAWLLAQKLSFELVSQAHLESYLLAFAQGETLATRPGKKSVRTLSFTRDVVLRMLSELERKGLRKSAQIGELKLPETSLRTAHVDAPSQHELDEWESMRQQWHTRAQPQSGSRDPLDRQFFVAEFIFCMAVTSQELADGVMSDFQAIDGVWKLRVRQNNLPTAKFIQVPAPAMAMLKRYRESRGLSSYPDASESNVPIVARQRSERRVNAWTIAKCLELLSSRTDGEPLTHRRRLSSRLLRRYLILRSLSRHVDERSLRRHVRSDYAVNTIFAGTDIKDNDVVASLTR